MGIDQVRQLIERAKSIAKGLGNRWDTRLERILIFCAHNPTAFPTQRGKKQIASLDKVDDKYLLAYIGRYYREREGSIVMKEVATLPDPVVDEVLKAFKKVPEERLESIASDHRLSMQAENIVGKLLERYVARFLEQRGWIWCCGQTMRAVDFMKDENSQDMQLLQIKNRDNSENSSSSAIRIGTSIQKWYRIKSKTGKTRWADLPGNADATDAQKCTEQGFYKFVQEEAARKPIVEESQIEEEAEARLQLKPSRKKLF